LLEPLLDFEELLERLDLDELERADVELLEPELDLVTLGALLDLRFPEELDLVTDELFGLDLDLSTLVLFVVRVAFEGRFRVLGVLYPKRDLLPDDVRLL